LFRPPHPAPLPGGEEIYGGLFLSQCPSHRSFFYFSLITVWVFLLFPLKVAALEWEVGPSVGLRGEFNDNVRLTTADHDAVWGVTASPRLKVNALDESGGLKGDVRFEPVRYINNDELDSNNVFITLDSFLLSEFSQGKLGVAYTRDSTLQSELLDTGVTDVSKKRTQKSIAPSWQRTLSEYTTLELGYDYSDVSYEDAETIGLFDYDIGTISGTVSRLLTEFDYLNATLYYTAYDSPDAQSEFDDKGIQLGFSHVYSEYYQFDVSVGGRRTKYDNLIRENESSSGFIGDASLTRTYALGSVRGSVARRINPSGSGFLQQRDSLILNVTRKFTPLLNGSVSASVYRNKSLQKDDTRLDRIYYVIEPRLTWRLTRAWSSRLFYRYQYSQYDDASEEAQAHVVGVAALYRWPSPLN